MSEDEKTACMLLGDLGLVDSIGYVSRVVAYLKDEREACAVVCEQTVTGYDVSWLLKATKQDCLAESGRRCAAAIRTRTDP